MAPRPTLCGIARRKSFVADVTAAASRARSTSDCRAASVASARSTAADAADSAA